MGRIGPLMTVRVDDPPPETKKVTDHAWPRAMGMDRHGFHARPMAEFRPFF